MNSVEKTGKQLRRMNFISIAPFFPNDIPFTVQETRHLTEASGVRKHAYCMTMQPDGTDVYAKPQLCARAFHEIREALQGEPIEPGILIQSTVGHGWAGAVTCECGWTEIININNTTVHRLCMRDPNFQAYIRKMMQMLAAEKPAFFLVDDDLRSINNSSNGPECFCPLHMAEFCRRAGKEVTREELIHTIQTAPWDDPDVQLFEAIRKETLLDFARLIREAIDSVDPSIPCGYCSGGGEYLLAGELARILAGKNRSFLRINNANYMEMHGPLCSFYNRGYQTSFKVAAAEPVDDILDESDIYPHSLWSKSALTMHAHITHGILNGVSGGKLWISDLRNKNDLDVCRHRAIVKEHIGFYDALLREVAQVRWLGCTALLRSPAFRFHPGNALQPLRDENWNSRLLESMGIPTRYSSKIEEDALITLTADTVVAFSDADLRRILSGKVLVDGSAAFALAERGFGRYLGVDPEKKPVKSSGEWLKGREDCALLLSSGIPFLANAAKDAEILSEVRTQPYRYAPTFDFVMPGSVYYRNELGGQVITAAFSILGDGTNCMGTPRKEWALALIRKLEPEALLMYGLPAQDFYFRLGWRPDGTLLGAAYNLCLDSLPEVSFCSQVAVQKVEQLQNDGSWKEIPFVQQGEVLTVRQPMGTQEFLILRFTL